MKTFAGTILTVLLVCLLATGSFGWQVTATGFNGDPLWQELNNHTTTTTTILDYGYSASTNFAGGTVGEVGGQLARAVGLLSYYGADLGGSLTLSDACEMNWNSVNGARVYFDNLGSPNNDSSFLGFFNRAGMAPWGSETQQFLGIAHDGDDLYLMGLFKHQNYVMVLLKAAMDNQVTHSLRFKYDPNQGSYGAMTAQYGSETPVVYYFTQSQRDLSFSMDTFGLVMTDANDPPGTSIHLMYLDDVAYTANNAKLTCNVQLKDFGGDATLVPMRIEMTSGGNTITRPAVLTSNPGTITFDVAPAVYSIKFITAQFLTKTLPSVDLSDGAEIVSVELTNGNVDGDNVVSTTDVSTVISNLDQQNDP